MMSGLDFLEKTSVASLLAVQHQQPIAVAQRLLRQLATVAVQQPVVAAAQLWQPMLAVAVARRL